ncbi:MAG: serine/threonine-protein kinase [Nannocystaceae bacterium]|nr:serine/threonine protein kinase [Myxococcales bacterium]
MTSWVGRTINNRYELLREIGEGAMGTVYVGRRLHDDKQFAIKFLRPDLASQEQFAIRFEREAKAQSRLKHPNIVGAIEHGDLPDGGAFMVMQLVRGRDLKQIIEQEGPISWRRACTIGVQVADALLTAHELGIIHRDLKLANIMIEKSTRGRERALVLDFGLASLYQSDEVGGQSMEKLTVAGFVVGTPGYVAPEQLTDSSYDHTVDLYALGVCLWECVSGERLWKAATPMETLLCQLKDKPRALPRRGDEPPPEPLRRLIYALLSSDPRRRPQTAADVRNELGQILIGPDQSLSTGKIDRLIMSRKTGASESLDDGKTTLYRTVDSALTSTTAGRRAIAPRDETEPTERTRAASRLSMSTQRFETLVEERAAGVAWYVPYVIVGLVGATLVTLVVLGVL